MPAAAIIAVVATVGFQAYNTYAASEARSDAERKNDERLALEKKLAEKNIQLTNAKIDAIEKNIDESVSKTNNVFEEFGKTNDDSVSLTSVSSDGNLVLVALGLLTAFIAFKKKL